MIYTHKTSGWKRESIGWGNYRVIPADGSGERKVAFMSAGSWANLANDDRAKENEDRVVLMEGKPLPEWAVRWLEGANAKQCGKSRDAFRSMLDRADFDADMRDANSY